MRTLREHSAILAMVVMIGLTGTAVAQDATDPILRFDSASDMEVDIGMIVDDLTPLLMDGLASQDAESAAIAQFILDLLGVDALDRIHMEDKSSKSHSWGRMTITLDRDAKGGLLADLMRLPEGECGFAKYLRREDLAGFETIQNLPAFFDLVLDVLQRPELAELVGKLPVDEDGELSFGAFTPRRDLLPLLSGELDFFVTGMPEGAAMMGPMQMPYYLVIGSTDGPALLNLLFDVAGHFGGEQAAGMTMMLREIEPEQVGDFDLITVPMGGSFAVSDDYLVIGTDPGALRDMLADDDGDLLVPDGQSWAYLDGPKYAEIMEGILGMAAMMSPEAGGPNQWMLKMYGVLFEHLESETVHVTGGDNSWVIETEVEGEIMKGLYLMLREVMVELPTLLEMAQKQEQHKEANAYIGMLDAAMTAYGADNRGFFPADPTDLVTAGYLEEFPPLIPVPAGQYTEGGYTYHCLYDELGNVAGYFLFAYGGGEGTGFDVYTDANLADLEHFVVDADGQSDGVASFCYDGLAIAQWEAWQKK